MHFTVLCQSTTVAYGLYSKKRCYLRMIVVLLHIAGVLEILGLIYGILGCLWLHSFSNLLISNSFFLTLAVIFTVIMSLFLVFTYSSICILKKVIEAVESSNFQKITKKKKQTKKLNTKNTKPTNNNDNVKLSHCIVFFKK